MSIGRRGDLSFASRDVYLAVPSRLRQMVAPVQAEREIFLHLPKCGGTNINFLLAVCCGYARQRYQRMVVTDYRPSIWIRLGWTGAWGEIAPESLSKAAEAAFISGHLPFGIDGVLPGPSHYITVLRDPVDREISSYNFHYQRGFIDGQTPLEAYVERGEVIDNPQTRMLAGRAAMSGECTEETFVNAMRNLDTRFRLVGVVGHLHEFMCALLGLQDWPPVVYARAQLTAIRRIDGSDLRLRALLRGYHGFDHRLHQLAAERWREWAARHVEGSVPVGEDQDILMIPPDYYEKRTPYLLKRADLLRLCADPSR